MRRSTTPTTEYTLIHDDEDEGGEGEYDLVIEYDFQPPEPREEFYPGCRAEVTFNDATLDGEQFVLTDCEEREAEEWILEDITSEREEW